MQLTRKKKTPGDLVGLDIEAGSIAATQVKSNGSIEVTAAAIAPLAPGAFHEGEVADPDAIAAALKSLFATNKLSKKVRLGIGNQRVIVRTLRLPAIDDPKELDTAIRFQAQEQIPMPLDQAILEHQVVGGVPAQEGSPPMIDVVVVAARREMIGSFLEPIKRAGLEPVGIDLSAFGMIRALAGAEVVAAGSDGDEMPARPDHAVLYCNVGDVMNLAVARGRACLFTRVSSEGLGGIAAALGAQSGLTPEHATQWLTHVGLEQPLERVEGRR
jgi:type IV pilus assembly protein PilM